MIPIQLTAKSWAYIESARSGRLDIVSDGYVCWIANVTKRCANEHRHLHTGFRAKWRTFWIRLTLSTLINYVIFLPKIYHQARLLFALCKLSLINTDSTGVFCLRFGPLGIVTMKLCSFTCNGGSSWRVVLRGATLAHIWRLCEEPFRLSAFVTHNPWLWWIETILKIERNLIVWYFSVNHETVDV